MAARHKGVELLIHVLASFGKLQYLYKLRTYLCCACGYEIQNMDIDSTAILTLLAFKYALNSIIRTAYNLLLITLFQVYFRRFHERNSPCVTICHGLDEHIHLPFRNGNHITECGLIVAELLLLVFRYKLIQGN